MIAEASARVSSRLSQSVISGGVNGSVLRDCSSEVHCSSCKERFDQIGKLPRYEDQRLWNLLIRYSQ